MTAIQFIRFVVTVVIHVASQILINTLRLVCTGELIVTAHDRSLLGISITISLIRMIGTVKVAITTFRLVQAFPGCTSEKVERI